MDLLIQLALIVFACVGFGWLMVLVGKHGWGWVAAWLKARALAAEAALKAKAAEAAGPLASRVEAVEKEIVDGVHARLGELEPTVATLKADVAALRAKVGA